MIEIKYARYSRKSSESAEKQIVSVGDQNNECDQFAIEKELNVIIKLEEEKSAFKPRNRPKFTRLVELIESGDISGIITWKPDRLARNPEEGGKLIQLLQDGKLKEIRTPLGELYTQDSDHLILQIHFGMANQYSRNLSQNVRRGLKYKLKRGEYPAPAPIGYESFGDIGKRNIRPHPFEADILKEVFELASKGNNSLRILCEHAKKQGLRHKSGKNIGVSSMQRILTRPTYYGCFYWNGELCVGNYTPIISKKLFDKVQLALSDRTKPKQIKHDNPYNGLLKCGYCGCSITTTTKRKHYNRTDRTVTYVYHHCTKRRGGGCTLKSFTTEDIEKLIYDNFVQLSIDEDVWKLGLELVRTKHENLTKLNSERRIKLQNDYNNYQEKLNKLIEMRMNGEVTKEELTQYKSKLVEEQASTKSMLVDTEHSEHSWLELTEEFLNTAFHAKEILEEGNPFEKKELVKKLGQNLFINNENLVVTLKEPYNVLLQPAMRSSWLGNRESNPNFRDQNPTCYRYTIPQ